MDIIILGAGVAGSSAVFELRKLNKKINITLIDKQKAGYSPCSLPYIISKEIKRKDVFVIDETQYENYDINRLYNTAKKIDRKNKEVILDTKQKIKYDKLIIATGSRTFIPKIKGLENTEYFVMKTYEDEEKLRKRLDEKKIKKAVFIGGGWISAEVGEVIAQRGIKVTALESKENIMQSMLDKDIAEILKEKLKQKNVEFIENVSVAEIKNKKVIFDSKKIDYDILFLGTGMRINKEIAEECGLKTSRGILVNENLQTSDKNIYACGDCAEYINKITKKRGLSMLGSSAVKEGKITAQNVLGKKEEFPQFLNANISKIGDIFLGTIGITQLKAKENKIKTISATYEGYTKPEYCPLKKEIIIKLIADTKGKIIGSQIIGEEEVAPRINIISVMMQKEMTLKEIRKWETCYNPMTAPIFEPISIAAEMCLRKLER